MDNYYNQIKALLHQKHALIWEFKMEKSKSTKRNYLDLMVLVFSLFLVMSTGKAQTWESTGPYGGFVDCLIINSSDDIFAGTYYGFFRSSDNGNSWNVININGATAGVNTFAINSADDIFAGYGGGVLRSTDNGDNWTQVSNGLPLYTSIHALVISSTGYLFAGARDGGLFRSADNGAN